MARRALAKRSHSAPVIVPLLYTVFVTHRNIARQPRSTTRELRAGRVLSTVSSSDSRVVTGLPQAGHGLRHGPSRQGSRKTQSWSQSCCKRQGRSVAVPHRTSRGAQESTQACSHCCTSRQSGCPDRQVTLILNYCTSRQSGCPDRQVTLILNYLRERYHI